MSRDEVIAWVSRTMVAQFDLEPAAVRLDARLQEDLDLDSIDAVDMAVAMQELTGRKVEERDLRRIKTVADVVEQVERALSTPR